MGILKEIRKRLKGDATIRELIGEGFAESSVYGELRKLKHPTGKKPRQPADTGISNIESRSDLIPDSLPNDKDIVRLKKGDFRGARSKIKGS